MLHVPCCEMMTTVGTRWPACNRRDAWLTVTMAHGFHFLFEGWCGFGQLISLAPRWEDGHKCVGGWWMIPVWRRSCECQQTCAHTKRKPSARTLGKCILRHDQRQEKNDMHYLFLPRLFMFVDLVWLFCLCLLSEWWFLYDSILKSVCFERHMLLKNVNGRGWMPVFFSTKALVKWLFCYTRAFQCGCVRRVAPLSFFLKGKLCHPLSVWVLIRI